MTNFSNNTRIDLHLHSYYSDGGLAIADLIKLVKANGLKVVALTDHNTVAGVHEFLALAKKNGLKAISGIEIYTAFGKTPLHILGYGFDYRHKELVESLHTLFLRRNEAVKKTLGKLAKLGFKIDVAELLSSPFQYIGLGRLCKALYRFPENLKIIKRDLGSTTPHFFSLINYYFSQKGKAYLPETSMDFKTAVKLVRQAGGLTFLAHPSEQIGWNTALIKKLKKSGLNGLELLSPYHNWHDIEFWQKTALDNGLLVSGGSDFHAPIHGQKNGIIQRQWQIYDVPYEIFLQLKKNLAKK